MATNSEWKETTLGQISSIQTGPFGSQLHESDYVKVGTPIITVEHLLNDQISHDEDIPKVSAEDTQRLKGRYALAEGDIVFSRVGSVDRSAYVTKGEDGWLFSGRLLRVRPDEDVVSSKWLDYWLRQEKIKAFVRRVAVGATMPSINTSLLGEVPVLFPSIEQQEKIASVFSVLDNKIELLRRQNETLEHIAQAIFNEWFVKPTTDGTLPDGWSLKTVADVADVTIGRTPPRKEKEWFSLNPADKKWISIKDLGTAGTYVDRSGEYLTPEAVQRFKIPLIPSGTVVVSFKLTMGRVAITTEDMYSNEAIAHIKTHTLPIEYTYLYFKCFDYNRLGSTSSIATATNSEAIRGMEMLVPDAATLRRFTECASPLFAKILLNTHGIKTLITTRDTLLPRLMNGEIRL